MHAQSVNEVLSYSSVIIWLIHPWKQSNALVKLHVGLCTSHLYFRCLIKWLISEEIQILYALRWQLPTKRLLKILVPNKTVPLQISMNSTKTGLKLNYVNWKENQSQSWINVGEMNLSANIYQYPPRYPQQWSLPILRNKGNIHRFKPWFDLFDTSWSIGISDASFDNNHAALQHFEDNMEEENHQEKRHQKLNNGCGCVCSQLGPIFSHVEVFYSSWKALRHYF